MDSQDSSIDLMLEKEQPKQKPTNERPFVHTISQLNCMDTQELIMETEWGPERLYEERMERQANLFTPSQVARDLEKELQVSKINFQKKAEKEQHKALEEIRMAEKRKEVNAILKAKQESGDS